MKGWVTLATAGASAAYGVAGYFLEMHDTETMMAFVLGGTGAVGIGRKVDRNTEAAESAAVETARVAATTELVASRTAQVVDAVESGKLPIPPHGRT